MTQPRFRRAQPRLILIHCLYLAKLNPALRIGAMMQMVERRNDDLECWTMLVRARSTPQYFFQQCSLDCIRLHRRRPTIGMIEA